jgi:hypothetical protein
MLGIKQKKSMMRRNYIALPFFLQDVPPKLRKHAREDVTCWNLDGRALPWLPTHKTESQYASVISFTAQPHFKLFLPSLLFREIISLIPLMPCLFFAHCYAISCVNNKHTRTNPLHIENAG